MTTTDSSADGGAGASSTWTWLLPVLTFLAGCLLGALVVGAGAFDDGDGGGGTAAPEPSASGDAANSDPSPGPTDLVVRVPESCLDAADSATAFSSQVDDIVVAVRDLDARRLQEIVDGIQQSQPEVQRLADQCRSVAGERLEDGQLATSAPEPTPTS